MARYLYSELARAIQARRNCDAKHSFATVVGGIQSHCAVCGQLPIHAFHQRSPWFDQWTERIENLAEMLPSGSGLDTGTTLDLDASHGEKLVFHTLFHHMNDGGYYDGWTEHTVTVTPGFNGINIRISGRNRNGIKDYLHDTFRHTLELEIECPSTTSRVIAASGASNDERERSK